MIVYSVRNLVDGKIYIGASRRSLPVRKSQHKSRARLHTKDSRHTTLTASAVFYFCKRNTGIAVVG